METEKRVGGAAPREKRVGGATPREKRVGGATPREGVGRATPREGVGRATPRYNSPLGGVGKGKFDVALNKPQLPRDSWGASVAAVSRE